MNDTKEGIEGPAPLTRVRIWEIDDKRFPERTPEEWLALIRASQDGDGLTFEKDGLELTFENKNMVMDAGMTTLAAIQIGEQAAWESGKWYKQAVGAGHTSAARTQTDLVNELCRKSFTEFVRVGRVLTSSTLFTGADYVNASSTVASASTTAGCTLASATNFKVGDYIRVALTTGYEYRTIATLVGNAITYDTALSSAALVGALVDQLTDEAGFFGNEPAGYTTGTATFTNGSPTVTGTGTSWVGKVAAGDKIRAASSTKWYTILSVGGIGTITLTGNFAESTLTNVAYLFRGTMFNRVHGLQYQKTTRGFVYENQWTMGG